MVHYFLIIIFPELLSITMSNSENLRSWCRVALAKRRGFSGRYFWTKDGP
jgi:hypothetical protein